MQAERGNLLLIEVLIWNRGCVVNLALRSQAVKAECEGAPASVPAQVDVGRMPAHRRQGVSAL